MYAIATSLKRSPELDVREACQKGVRYICAARTPYKAWHYSFQDSQSDTSVTSWMVSALAAAKDLGLVVDPEAFVGATAWLDSVTDPQSGRTGYDVIGSQSARVHDVNDHYPIGEAECVTAAAIASRQLMGQDPENFEIVRSGGELLVRSLPEWEPEAYANDLLYWYYGTEALYRNRASWKREWQAWEKAVNEALLESQEREVHVDGSWEPDRPLGSFGWTRVLNVPCGADVEASCASPHAIPSFFSLRYNVLFPTCRSRAAASLSPCTKSSARKSAFFS